MCCDPGIAVPEAMAYPCALTVHYVVLLTSVVFLFLRITSLYLDGSNEYSRTCTMLVYLHSTCLSYSVQQSFFTVDYYFPNAAIIFG